MASSLNMPELNHGFQRKTMVSQCGATLSTMVEFRDRLKAAMGHANVKREWLMSRLNVSRVAIDKLLDGRSKSMTAKRCAITARLLKVNYFWFATGQGEMLADAPPEVQIGGVFFVAENSPPPYNSWPMTTITQREYCTLTERQQGHIEGQIRAMLDTNHDKSNGGQAAA